MGETEHQIAVLQSAIQAAKEKGGSPNQKRLYAVSVVRIAEKQYRDRRMYTQAMWTAHLITQMRYAEGTLMDLLVSMKAEGEPPYSNTGVHSDEANVSHVTSEAHNALQDYVSGY